MNTRRALLKALVAAPVIITTPGLLMPVRKVIWTPVELTLNINTGFAVGSLISIKGMMGMKEMVGEVVSENIIKVYNWEN